MIWRYQDILGYKKKKKKNRQKSELYQVVIPQKSYTTGDY